MILEGFARSSSEGALLATQAIVEPSSMDHVGAGVYARWWADRGAKVGYVFPSLDRVEWIDGTVGTLADAAEALDAWKGA